MLIFTKVLFEELGQSEDAIILVYLHLPKDKRDSFNDDVFKGPDCL